MNLKSRKPFQIGAVSLALTMLASYVVYSQKQNAQNIAPGSKSDVILNRAAIQQQSASTNPSVYRSSTFVASGSKSLSPVFAIPATNASKSTKGHVTNAPSPMLFPGSKSAAVFHPQDISILMPRPAFDAHFLPAPLPRPNESRKDPTFSPGTNATAALKP